MGKRGHFWLTVGQLAHSAGFLSIPEAPRPALLILSHPETEAATSPRPAVYLFQTQDDNDSGEGQTTRGPRSQKKSCINLRLLTLPRGQERLETEEGEASQAPGRRLNPKLVMALIFVNQSLQFFFTLLAKDMFGPGCMGKNNKQNVSN